MNAIREQFERIKADKFLLTWNIVNLFVLLGPLIVFGVARRGAENYNNGNNNNNNNNNNYQENWNGQNEYRYDQYGNFLGQKHWWQFWKRNNHYNQNGVSYYQEQNQGGQQENGFGAPWWFFWTDDRPEEEQGSGTILFVYLWTIVSLIALAVVGTRLVQKGHYDGLRFMFFAFINYSFIVMVMLGGLDAIQTEGREIEETGWYGQTSVLLFLTCLCGMVKSLIFQFWLHRKSKQARSAQQGSEFELMGNEGGANV